MKEDKWVNKRRIAIGMEAFSLIARQQPMAGDMRLIAAVLEIIGEMERIHDYVKGIGNINIMIGEEEDSGQSGGTAAGNGRTDAEICCKRRAKRFCTGGTAS
jgi:hypothetical protein